MLTCPNCGTENRYGAIFCRVCGKKLEIIDEITVENIDEKTRGKRRRRKKDKGARTPKEMGRRGIIINAIRIAVILLVAFAVYLTQQTPPVSAIPTSEVSQERFIRKRNQLRDALEKKNSRSETVTQKELNSYIAGLVPDMEKGKVVKIENVQVALGNDTDQEKISVRMYVRVFGKKMLFQIFGEVNQNDGEMQFSPDFLAKIGKLPYPAFLMKWHCRKMLEGLKNDSDLFKKLTDVTVREVKLAGGKKTPAVVLKVGSK